ncbi:MAG: hypothetical protein MUC36_20530 [Planctomycetes bacterium]|jgi:hypothetical protein|nr:hypothetical protein [Planctomycetota bacterium]
MQVVTSALLAGLVLANVSAQTFVVDINNGPGANYTSLATAAANAPDGAVLIVRAGSYPGMTISGKGLKVLADPGVIVFGTTPSAAGVAVAGVPTGKSVVIQGITVASGFPGWAGRVSLFNCQGSVLLDRLGVSASVFGVLTAQQCNAVLVKDASSPTASLRTELTQSNVAFENSRISVSSGSALSVTGGTVQLRDCNVLAGVFVAPANAIVMTGGEVRILGNTTLQAGITGQPQTCIGGTGTVRHEPSVTFTNGAPFGASIVASAEVMPRMRATFAGGQVAAELHGTPGSIGVIALGLIGQPVPIPGIPDPLWIDSGSTFLLSFGVFAPGVPVTHNLPWVSGPVPAVRAVWQGIALDANGGMQLSNPSLTILP